MYASDASPSLNPSCWKHPHKFWTCLPAAAKGIEISTVSRNQKTRAWVFPGLIWGRMPLVVVEPPPSGYFFCNFLLAQTSEMHTNASLQQAQAGKRAVLSGPALHFRPAASSMLLKPSEPFFSSFCSRMAEPCHLQPWNVGTYVSICKFPCSAYLSAKIFW